ncbi:hypothetical protein BDV11DRAFT_45944 [Aspergillus similis]
MGCRIGCHQMPVTHTTTVSDYSNGPVCLPVMSRAARPLGCNSTAKRDWTSMLARPYSRRNRVCSRAAWPYDLVIEVGIANSLSEHSTALPTWSHNSNELLYGVRKSRASAECHAYCKEGEFRLLTQSFTICLISFQARPRVGVLWEGAVQAYPHASKQGTRIRHVGWDHNAMRGIYWEMDNRHPLRAPRPWLADMTVECKVVLDTWRVSL